MQPIVLIIISCLSLFCLKVEFDGPSIKRVFMRSIVLVLTTLICLIVRGCPFGRVTERAVETYTFPGGEFIRNESGVEESSDFQRYNNLSYQQSAVASREAFVQVKELGKPPAISLHAPMPQLIQSGEQAVIVLGPHIFRRSLTSTFGGAVWNKISRTAQDDFGYSTTDPQVSAFLRTYLHLGDPRLNVRPHPNRFGRLIVPDLKVPYAFDSFDLKNNVYTTHCAAPNSGFPNYLVYKIPEHESYLSLDLELTRMRNHLPPLEDKGLQMECSIITYKVAAGVSFHDKETHTDALRQPGAAETQDVPALPLRASTPTLSACSYQNISHELNKKPCRVEAEFRFFDALPDYAFFAWRQQSANSRDGPMSWRWSYTKLNEWLLLESIHDIKGERATQVYLRIKMPVL
jgi:hypothetical protein